MQTSFTLAQLADPDVAEADKILRACVHCGFCTATCPTYVLLGDELDSPRGRIYLIKDMLENDRPATEEVVKHIDRCLSCLACMTTCPSGVHYMHLVDHARVHIEETYARSWPDRALRALLANVLPYPGRFRAALWAGWLPGQIVKLLTSFATPGRRKGEPVAPGWTGVLPRLAAMLSLVPARPPAGPVQGRTVFPGARAAQGARRAAARLRAARARAFDQRGGDPPAHATRHRGRAGGRGMLRLARSSHGPRASGARSGARCDRCVDARDRRRRTRCNPGNRFWLWDNHQGLRLHAAHGCGLCGQGVPRVRAGEGYFRVSVGP